MCDHTVYFNSLTLDLIKQIVEKNLIELKKSLAAKNVDMTYTDAVVDHLAKVSYDPIYGARPVARKIDQLIKANLVDEILFGKLKTGGEFQIDYVNSTTGPAALDFKFTKSTPATPSPTATATKNNSKNKKKVTVP